MPNQTSDLSRILAKTCRNPKPSGITTPLNSGTSVKSESTAMQVSRFRSFLFHLASIYWKVFRPKTFGVKGIVPHPDDDRQILLIRNTYGNRMLWNLPGGGYQPKRESPERAIDREIREELSVTSYNTERLGQYRTDTEGKRDTVIIFLCRITADRERGR